MNVPTVILGTGTSLPDRIVTNHELESMLNTSDDWIRQRSGIVERRWASAKTATSDLALAASQKALARAGLNASDLDMIILATLSPDHEFPATACFLQAKLGVKNTPAMDIRQACSGFMFGLSVARQFIATGAKKKILLVGSEIHSKCLDLTPKGRDVSVLFGDGAGAVVLGPADEKRGGIKILDVSIGTDGSQAKELWTPAPGTGFQSTSRLSPDMIAEGLQYPAMQGRTVFMHAVQTMTQILRDILRVNGLEPHSVDRFILHQANQRIVEAVGQQLGVSSDRFFNTIQKYGNTSAASLPIGIHDAMEAGALRQGQTAAFAVFGAGFSWGAALAKWD